MVRLRHDVLALTLAGHAGGRLGRGDDSFREVTHLRATQPGAAAVLASPRRGHIPAGLPAPRRPLPAGPAAGHHWVELDGCGHAAQLERPLETAELNLGWIVVGSKPAWARRPATAD